MRKESPKVSSAFTIHFSPFTFHTAILYNAANLSLQQVTFLWKNDLRLKGFGRFKIHSSIRYNNNDIPYCAMPCSRPVKTTYPGSFFTFDEIGFYPGAVVDIYDLDLFVLN